jgi:hypothetical protein
MYYCDLLLIQAQMTSHGVIHIIMKFFSMFSELLLIRFDLMQCSMALVAIQLSRIPSTKIQNNKISFLVTELLRRFREIGTD